jgi:pimeloyl-ACP methyl ester carboxylesterase
MEQLADTRSDQVLPTVSKSTNRSSLSFLGAINIPVEELKWKYLSTVDSFIEYEGMQVRYRDEGKGPVLVLLHGVCASLETWDGWARELKKKFRVIRMDIPGFGITGPAPDTSYYTRDRAVEMLDFFVSKLGIKKFHLAGNSLGGYISWNYALTYPKKVQKLILIDSVGYNQKLPLLLEIASNPATRFWSRMMMPRFMLYMAVHQVYGDKSKVRPEVQRRYFDYAMRAGNKGSYVDVFLEMRKQNRSADLAKDIPNLKVPTMVMWGEKDEWIPFKYFENWKKDLPGATFKSYAGAGHVPMEEIPEITAGDAAKFLK